MHQRKLLPFGPRTCCHRAAGLFLLLFHLGLSLNAQAPAAGTNSAQAENILRRALASLDRSDSLRSLYTYREFTEERDLDGGGRTKDVHTKLQEVLYLGEKRYQHLLAKDGKPLEGTSAKREEERMQRAVTEADKLTEAQRTDLRAKAEHQRHQNNEFWQYIPAAYDISQLADETIDSRPVYVLSLTPKPNYHGKYSSFLNRIKAKLYVDKKDDMLSRLDAEMIDDVSLGFVLARISKGTHFKYELARVNDEVWLPKLVDVQGSMRLLLRSMRGEEKTTFSDYRKYQAESRVVSTSAQ